MVEPQRLQARAWAGQHWSSRITVNIAACAAVVSLSTIVSGSVYADQPTAPPSAPSDPVPQSSQTNVSGPASDIAAPAPAPSGAPSRGYRRGDTLVRTALSYRGLPYRWGGTSARSGFDCSGLVQTVCAKWGIYLPRCASQQINCGVPVKPSDLQPGDLVFFKNTYKRGLSHVGIYVGDGWFIHAASRRHGVMLSRLDTGYHKQHWYGARRLNLSRLPSVPGEEALDPQHVVIEDDKGVAADAGPTASARTFDAPAN